MSSDHEPADVTADAREYNRRLVIGASRERVFDAIATVDGPRYCCAAEVSESAAADGELRFEFAGLDELMVMRVTASQRPSAVTWSCVKHTRNNEWAGTVLEFRLTACGPSETELDFRH